MTAKRLRIFLVIHQRHRRIEAHQRYFVLLKLVQRFTVETCGLFKSFDEALYLRRFPIDKLKIDIAFIREVTSNPQDAAIAKTIIELAHSLDLQVIAEGVETVEQLAFLTENGCDQVQGYLFSRPLPISELHELLRERTCFT